MAQWQGQSNRKSTGGRLVPSKGKRKFEIGREKQYTKLGTQSLKQYRTCGGNVKVGMLAAYIQARPGWSGQRDPDCLSVQTFSTHFPLSDSMAYDDDNAIVLWPEYFDRNRTRSQGRRLPVQLCVDKPDLDIIAKGAMILDLEFKIFEDKSYPADWAAHAGCVRVEKGKISKSELLREIGKTLVANS